MVENFKLTMGIETKRLFIYQLSMARNFQLIMPEKLGPSNTITDDNVRLALSDGIYFFPTLDVADRKLIYPRIKRVMADIDYANFLTAQKRLKGTNVAAVASFGVHKNMHIESTSKIYKYLEVLGSKFNFGVNHVRHDPRLFHHAELTRANGTGIRVYICRAHDTHTRNFFAVFCQDTTRTPPPPGCCRRCTPVPCGHPGQRG